MSGNSEATTGTDAWIFGHETGPAWHVRVSTMRRQITLKILRQIIFEMEVLAFIDAAGAKSVIMTGSLAIRTKRVSTTMRARVVLVVHFGPGGNRWTGNRTH